MAGILADNIDPTAHEIADTQRLALASMKAAFDLVPKGPGRKSFDNFIGMHKITAENLQQSQGTRQIRKPGVFAQRDCPRSQMQSPGIR